jgi:hypothetical protein
VPSLAEIGPAVMDKILNILGNFLLFCYYFPLKKGAALYLNNLEFPPPKDKLCQLWLKLAQWLWRRRFINICIF